jgi:sn-glycerol 3-phosphate transport system permease protein
LATEQDIPPAALPKIGLAAEPVGLWTSVRSRRRLRLVVMTVLALAWLIPFVWVLAVSFRPPTDPIGAGSRWFSGSLTLDNYLVAWARLAASYRNTLVIVFGTLAVQVVTVTLAGSAFARMRIPAGRMLFVLLLTQIMIPTAALVVPNFFIIRILGLYDNLLAVMILYFGSAFGTFIMRQAFRQVPRELEEAAVLEGAGTLRLILNVYLPGAWPALIAFSFASIAYHWNDFLWPFMVTTEATSPLSVRLSLIATTEGGIVWTELAAATMITVLPPLLLFVVFQRYFINTALASGLK